MTGGPVMVMKSPLSRKLQCGYLANLAVPFGTGGIGALSKVYITKDATEWSWKNSAIWFLCIAIFGYKPFFNVEKQNLDPSSLMK